jgi:tRNA dimethylallyltransferase
VRIERALEVYHETGKTIGELHSAQKYTPPFDYLKIALSYPREELYERINSRVEQMIQSGLVEEVQALVRDFPRAEILHSAIGYKEVVDYLENTLSYEEMIENLKRNSRRFAKRQITLFNKISGVFWFTPPNPEKIGNLVEDFLNGGQK